MKKASRQRPAVSVGKLTAPNEEDFRAGHPVPAFSNAYCRDISGHGRPRVVLCAVEREKFAFFIIFRKVGGICCIHVDLSSCREKRDLNLSILLGIFHSVNHFVDQNLKFFADPLCAGAYTQEAPSCRRGGSAGTFERPQFLNPTQLPANALSRCIAALPQGEADKMPEAQDRDPALPFSFQVLRSVGTQF